MHRTALRCELLPEMREGLQRMPKAEAKAFANRLALTLCCGMVLLAKEIGTDTAVSQSAIEIGELWEAFAQKFPAAPSMVQTAAAVDFIEIAAGKIWALHRVGTDTALKEKLLSLVQPITRKLH